VFTQSGAVGYVLDALVKGVERGIVREEDVSQERLEGFFGNWGRKFYEVEEPEREGKRERIVTRRGKGKVVDLLRRDGLDVEVVPFRKGEETWSVEWK